MPGPAGLATLGSRWTLQILVLLLDGPRRFSDLRRGLPGISAKLLTQRLRELQAAGLLDCGPALPSTAANAYSIAADIGRLRPALQLLSQWQADASLG